eukprot:2749059-Rhodomonas_salina.2
MHFLACWYDWYFLFLALILCVHYAKSGTDLRGDLYQAGQVGAITLQIRDGFGMPATIGGQVDSAICLRLPYAMSGTGLVYLLLRTMLY